MTSSERILWEGLRNKRLEVKKFYRLHPIYNDLILEENGLKVLHIKNEELPGQGRHRISRGKPGTRNQQPATRNHPTHTLPKPTPTRNQEPGTRNQQPFFTHITQTHSNQEPETRNQEPSSPPTPPAPG